MSVYKRRSRIESCAVANALLSFVIILYMIFLLSGLHYLILQLHGKNKNIDFICQMMIILFIDNKLLVNAASYFSEPVNHLFHLSLQKGTNSTRKKKYTATFLVMLKTKQKKGSTLLSSSVSFNLPQTKFWENDQYALVKKKLFFFTSWVYSSECLIDHT